MIHMANTIDALVKFFIIYIYSCRLVIKYDLQQLVY